MSRRDDIIAEIACEERKVAKRRAELAELEDRLTSLREELASLPVEPASGFTLPIFSPTNHAPVSNAEKIALFRSLFRGREDVFPRRWKNPRTGRSGYSPTCANEWQIGVCEKKSKASGGTPAMMLSWASKTSRTTRIWCSKKMSSNSKKTNEEPA